MSDPTLIKHYHNLLVMLAKDYVSACDYAKKLTAEAESEPKAGRKSGLYCKAKSANRSASTLRYRLTKNRIVLMTLFGTSNLVTISKQQLR